MNLTACIRELLHRYDCVVVPGFGGFICNFEPARIHPVQHKFYPPSKRISFNQLLQVNDGLLAHFLARTESVTYQEAVEIINVETGNWKKKLRSGQRLQLDSIGDFFYDSQEKLLFQADTSKNYLNESYGLTVFQSLPIERTQKLTLVHSEKPEPLLRIEKDAFAWNKLANYSSAAAMISLIALTTFKLNLLDETHLNRISLNPFVTESGVYNPLPYGMNGEIASFNETPVESKFNDESINFMEYQILDKKITVKLRDEVAEESVEKAVVLGPYHVVAGCFGVEKNAGKLHRKLIRLGYEANLSGMHKGLHVVSYQSFASRREAKKMLSQVRDEHNAQAWVLKK